MMHVIIEDQVTTTLTRLIGSAGSTQQQLAQEEAAAILPFIRERTPVGTHYDFGGMMHAGGQLRDSLHFVFGQWGAYLAGAQYGSMVITGTRAHPITPRTATALAFYWARAGESVMRKRVQHPGTQPNDFRQTGLQEAFGSMAVLNTAERVFGGWLTGGAS